MVCGGACAFRQSVPCRFDDNLACVCILVILCCVCVAGVEAFLGALSEWAESDMAASVHVGQTNDKHLLFTHQQNSKGHSEDILSLSFSQTRSNRQTHTFRISFS